MLTTPWGGSSLRAGKKAPALVVTHGGQGGEGMGERLLAPSSSSRSNGTIPHPKRSHTGAGGARRLAMVFCDPQRIQAQGSCWLHGYLDGKDGEVVSPSRCFLAHQLTKIHKLPSKKKSTQRSKARFLGWILGIEAVSNCLWPLFFLWWKAYQRGSGPVTVP